MTTAIATPQTREAWLEEAVRKLEPLFIDVELPDVRVSVGWPSRGGTSQKKKVIGQCWKGVVSTDGKQQLFISPVLGDDVVQVLGVLLHELIHAWDDCESGHKGAFAKMARKLGLAGKLTATVVEEGSDLYAALEEIANQLGDYPHSTINFAEMEKQRKPQGTRMLKVVCPEDEYTIRTTQKWIDMGLPTCPCGTEMELA